MDQTYVNHPANRDIQPLPTDVYEAMFEIFEQICSFWGNLDNPESYKTRLFDFMNNRIKLRPEYWGTYSSARHTMNEMISAMGKAEAYKKLFTDIAANDGPPETPLALVRQKVSNEFIAFQVSQGGFKAFSGALTYINYPNYTAGAYILGEPAPYRTDQEVAQ
jgi:hypothetical protein